MKKNTPEQTAALWISNIFSPPIIGGALILAYAGRIASSRTEFWYWGGLATLTAIIIPSLVVLGGFLIGKYSNLHLDNKNDRFWPLFIAVLGSALSIWILMRSNAPRHYIILMISVLMNEIVFTMITLGWKISIHTSTITSACVASIYLFGWQAVVSLALIPLVMWSRLFRKKHTVAQALAGIIISAIVTMIIFFAFDLKPNF